MIRTSHGVGRVAPGESDVILGTVRTWAGTETRGVIFCHGAGDLFGQPYRDQRPLLDGLARHATVSVADLGGDPFGNDTAIARIAAVRTQLQSWGVTGKIALVGMSMGFANALAYTRANPGNVACVAGVIPLTDLTDGITRDAGVAAGINAAYGGTYNDATHGPTHNPIRYAASLPADLPIRLWSAPDDIYTPHAVTQAFVAARPQTELTTLPALNHTDAAVTAATPSMIQWVHAHL